MEGEEIIEEMIEAAFPDAKTIVHYDHNIIKFTYHGYNYYVSIQGNMLQFDGFNLELADPNNNPIKWLKERMVKCGMGNT